MRNSMNSLNLWDHQKKAILEIEAAWLDGINSVCYQLATGGGKSRIIRAIVDNHSRNKKIIYIIAHRKNLVRQLSQEIETAGIRHGIIAAGIPYIKYRVQVASLQTIVRRIDGIPEPEILIIDEFHHAKSKSYMNLIQAWPKAKILGVTATPARLDGSPLGDICQRLFVGPSMKELIKSGHLSDYKYYAPGNVDLDGVHIKAGEYVQSEILARVDKRTITGNAVDHYRKRADHKPAIASCVNIIHSEHVAEEFRTAGYKAIAIHSGLTDIDIHKAINGLRTGIVEVLCQCELLGEGIDIPGATVLIGLRPTNSLVVFLQHIGRVLRKAKGKDRAIVLDHVGNWERHDLPDDEREWSLTGKIKKKDDPLKHKRCPDCIQIVPKSTRVCPFCGHQWTETAEAGKRALPEQKEGELVDVRLLRQQKNADTIRMIRTGAKDMKEACKIAGQQGYRSGYGYFIWKKILKKA